MPLREATGTVPAVEHAAAAVVFAAGAPTEAVWRGCVMTASTPPARPANAALAAAALFCLARLPFEMPGILRDRKVPLWRHAVLVVNSTARTC
jgi:hypothetical protein